MNKKEANSRQPQGKDLRAEAKRRLGSRRIMPADGMADVDVRALLHELQVHQIELEMQNEELRRAQTAEQEVSDKYHDLYDFAPVGYFLLDEQGRILEVNLTGAELLGLHRSSVVRKRFGQFVALEHRAEFADFCKRRSATSARQTCEVKLQRGEQWRYALLEILLSHDRAMNGPFQITATDITELMRAVEEIRSLAEFTEENPNPVMRASGDRLVQYANQPARRLLEEMGWQTGQPLPEELSAQARRVLESDANHEFDLLCPGGRTYSFALAPSSRTGQVNFHGRDITERKQAEDLISNAKKLGDSLSRISTAIHSTFDIDEILERIIVEAVQAIGCETAAISLRHGDRWVVRCVHGIPIEVVGRQMDDAQLPHAALALKMMSPVVINDAFHDERVNTDQMMKCGVRSVMVAPLATGGNPLGVIFFNRHAAAIPFDPVQVDFARKLALTVSLALDNAKQVEERKRAEEALLQMNESLEQRVARRTEEVQRQADHLRALAVELSQAEQRERKRLSQILHDHIQQLLVAALMQVESLKRDNDLERMRAKAQGVGSMLQEALDASGSLTVELSPPVLHTVGLIGGLHWLISRMQEKHQFTVILRADRTAEPASEETRHLLFECARELLFNAVKHSEVKESHVTLLRTRDHHIQLVIRDEGKGFDPDWLKKRSAGEATFGLFSVQQRLAHFGGEMEIATAPGKGTAITLILPAAEAKPLTEEIDETLKRAERTEEIRVHKRTIVCRVLVVDDHKIMREGLIGLFRFEPDIEVVGQAADGLQAIELAEQLQPDVITMDVNLGEMSGVEATRIILAKFPNIKVIGLSMYTENDMANAMCDAGAIAYVTKGGRPEDLLAAIRAACAGCSEINHFSRGCTPR